MSREEWIHHYGDDKLFDAYDLDGDGIISPEAHAQQPIGGASQPIACCDPGVTLSFAEGESST